MAAPAAPAESNRFHLTCQRCGATWEAYVANPKVCRHCKNPAWNIPRDATLSCPVPGCTYTATGPRARVMIAKHVQNTADEGHGERYRIPETVERALRGLGAAPARA
jgi:ribosomal protein L37E